MHRLHCHCNITELPAKALQHGTAAILEFHAHTAKIRERRLRDELQREVREHRATRARAQHAFDVLRRAGERMVDARRAHDDARDASRQVIDQP